MKPKIVLFICVHNSGRSQIAEAYLHELSKGSISAASAGLKPKPILPMVADVMREDGIDISTKTSKSVFDLYKQGKLYDVVITVCDDSIESQCPIFPGITKRLHWSFPDPEQVIGTQEEKLIQIRQIRDNIKKRILEWLAEIESE